MFDVRLRGGAGRKPLKSQETSFRQREEKHKSLCQSASPESNDEETSDKMEGQRLQKFQEHHCHEMQSKSEELFQMKGDSRDMMTGCNR